MASIVKATTTPDGPGVDQRARIVAAAREQFSGGVQNVRMQDVATAAGISRAYLYTVVPGREALVELALVARVQEYGDDLEARARDVEGDVADAIVDQAMHGIRLALTDPEFGRLADALPRTRLAHLLNSAESPIHRLLVRSFEPLLARALDQGLLRTDIPLDRIYDWMQSMHGHLVSRDDLDEAARQQMLRDFVLPAILASPA